MRNLGVLSVLLLGVSTLGVSGAQAGNYVPQQNYGGADVVVNMDVLANSGYGSAPSGIAPVLQQPLQAPRMMQQPPLPPLRRPMPHGLQQGLQNNSAAAGASAYPGYVSAPVPLQMAPAPLPLPPQAMPMPPQQPPMNISQPAPIAPRIAKPLPNDLPDITPVAESAPSAPAPAAAAVNENVLWDRQTAAAAPAAMAKAPLPAPSAPNPYEPTPYSTSELAASAAPKVAEKAPKKIPERTPEKTVAKAAAPEMTYMEKPVADATPPADEPARQLLAQAREKADSSAAHEERQVVLFDNAPSAPKSNATQTASLKPSALPMPPEENLKEPAPLVADNAPMPTPVLKSAAITPSAPIVASLPKPTVSSAFAPAAEAEQKVASIKPVSLPDVAPASIPNEATKKAETVVDDFEAYRLLFDRSSAELKPTEREVLDNIIARLKRDDGIRLQLRAYAAGTPDTTSQARRLSLSRALAVRSYLAQQGISLARLDVRALGMGTSAMGDVATRADIPADRVDLIFTR